MHGGTLPKNVSALGFSRKPSSLESVFSYHEIFGVTYFLLVLGICIVNAMLFINKIWQACSGSDLPIVKDPQYDKFGYVGLKVCLSV